MDYEALRAEHDALRRQFLDGDLEPAELVAEAVMLRSRTAELADPEDKDRIEAQLDALERLATYGESPAGAAPRPDAATSRATEALQWARQDTGTTEERIARAERGIAEIRRIAADATNSRERMAILRSTDLLARLASSLRGGGPVTGRDNSRHSPQ